MSESTYSSIAIEGAVNPPMPEANAPASPLEGPVELPTPTLPSTSAQPVLPSIPTQPTMPTCPTGFRPRTVGSNQSFTDLLLENGVSYEAMRAANPTLSTDQPSPGTVYCAPPAGSRKLCTNGAQSYVIEQGETLYSLTRTLGLSIGRLLSANPSLAPSDFLPGRVICLPG